MNTGYGMPSRRRLRGPLHPRNRPPPSSFDEPASSPQSAPQTGFDAASMPPPSSTPSSKKREWTSTIGRGGLGSLPWEQMGPSSSGPSTSSAEFSFQSGMAMPQSTSTTSMASMASMPSSSSASSFASFRQQPTPMSASPSSFRTAADADESGYAARSTIFSRGNQSAQAALRETSQALHESTYATADEQPRKRRRGLAGTIVDTALNAALYTGAAALTAYSLWSSWGHAGDAEQQQHHPDAGPQADMGDVISQNERTNTFSGKESRMPPGGLEEPPPPYYEDHSTPSRQEAAPTTPQSNSVRTRKVFVSSQRNRRRPTFQGSKTHRQSTPRKALPDAFRASHTADSPSMSASGSRDLAPAQMEDDDDDDDDDDEMLSRFEAKMNALIAEGQAALNSTPVLQESDLRDIDAPSPSLGLGTHSRSSTPLFDQRSQLPGSPFASLQPDAGMARSSSHPDDLVPSGALPEPVKRTFGTSLRHSRSAFDFQFDNRAAADTAAGPVRSPFVFGRAELNESATPSPAARQARRTDLGTPTSPYSRIPRSTSTLNARKSTPHHR
ncbi:hypothetical protein PANT_22c00167 [Moesziomyces antarcticus T-34]|uniref:Uncharacterized protein n=1 Tax=Pseudozyma antarctica (strain T-34) TaxID=1151754 RepID=M9M701_PSEA3|nr:hypothetical protein PANT_22c00167 [Moesziomyces antarcticus T-34]